MLLRGCQLPPDLTQPNGGGSDTTIVLRCDRQQHRSGARAARSRHYLAEGFGESSQRAKPEGAGRSWNAEASGHPRLGRDFSACQRPTAHPADQSATGNDTARFGTLRQPSGPPFSGAALAFLRRANGGRRKFPVNASWQKPLYAKPRAHWAAILHAGSGAPSTSGLGIIRHLPPICSSAIRIYGKN